MKIAMDDLKPCPFCGGKVWPEEITTTPYKTETTVRCTACYMRFSYSQEYAFSRVAKVDLRPSFQQIWNRRASDG